MGDLSKRAMLEQILARSGLISDKADHISQVVDQILAIASLPQPRVRFALGPVSTRTLTQGTTAMAITLTDIQHVPAALQELDAAGNPVPADFAAPPTWTSSDDTVVTVTPSADGTTADISTTGKLGSAQVTVTATTNSGTALTGIGDVTVVTSGATTISVTFGTPVDK